MVHTVVKVGVFQAVPRNNQSIVKSETSGWIRLPNWLIPDFPVLWFDMEKFAQDDRKVNSIDQNNQAKSTD